MALDVLSWALNQDTDTPVDKLVLIMLADFATDQGEAFPAIAQLAEVTCASQKQVRESLEVLTERGLIKEVPPADPSRAATWKVGR